MQSALGFTFSHSEAVCIPLEVIISQIYLSCEAGSFPTERAALGLSAVSGLII